MSHVPLTPTRAVWLVARREIVTRVRSRAFILGTLGMLVGIAAYIGLMYVIGQNASTSTVALNGQATAIAEPLRSGIEALGEHVEIREVSDTAEAEQQLRDGDLDALISGAPGDLRVLVKHELNSKLQVVLDGITRQQVLDASLAQAGLDPLEVQRAVAEAGVQVTALETPDPERPQRLVLAFAFSFVLYLSLVLFGMMVAQGVVEEKASRVVELLLSTVRPWQLLLGKVVGIGIVGLIQLVVVGGVGLAGALATDMLTIPGAAVGTLVSAVGWYLLGFFTFATMLAAASSLVSRQEEVQSVVQPVILLLVIPFVLGVTLLGQNPEDRTAEVLSLIPPFSPMLMPARTALGVAPVWQIALSVALTVAALAGLVWLGGRIYANAVLRTGARLSLREALRGE
ncbi:MAG TPA: ABC transporter permease [Pseudonocardiaceae bacterium]